jgi:GAF domain-containing protein
MRRRSARKTSKPEGKRPLAGTSPSDGGAKVRELEQRLADAVKREEETRDRETATAEILRVISSSPGDVLPTFEAIATAATRLCAAQESGVLRFDGALMHLVANDGFTAEERDVLRAQFPRPADGGIVTGRAILTRAVAHVTDITRDPGYDAIAIQQARLMRTVLSVPMLRNGQPVGAITVTRREANPFSPAQIALLETFADQAVIAIENVRLFTELEARNRDLTATSEILRVISSSPTDVQPVFDAIVDSAATLCDAVFSVLSTFDGHQMDIVAAHNWSPAAWTAARRTMPGPPSRTLVTGRAILERAVVHVPDVALDPEFDSPDLRRTIGFRSGLAVPMLSDGMPVGAIGVGRAEPGPFSDNQIALLKTFADQAIIALENVRLFHELQTRNRDLTESLEQQTATSDVLRVISRSQTDVQPVFDALIDSARKLCVADIGAITRLDGEVLHLALHSGMSAAVRAFWEEHPVPLNRVTVTGRAAVEHRTMHVPDILADPSYGYATDRVWHEAQTITGYRAAAVAPMLRDGAVVGTIGVFRSEPRPFAAGQIKLLETFADQAVIAIENARLFAELEARNRDLTATGEILQVISRSPTDVQPVFEAIAESAARLTSAVYGVTFLVADNQLSLAAVHIPGGGSREQFGRAYPIPLDDRTLATRIAHDGVVANIADIETDPSLPEPQRQRARMLGARALLIVPMLRDGRTVGMLIAGRAEAGAFTDQQVALLETFAHQAVIATENVRLFHELRAKNVDLAEALDQQTATAEILRVISSSPTDIQPVFDAIVQSGMRLCEGDQCVLIGREGGTGTFLAAHHHTPEAAMAIRAELPRPLGRDTTAGRAILERRTVQIPDILEDPEYGLKHLTAVARYRATVAVPMMREGDAIGAMTISREAPGEFSPRHIEILKTFADQAVIALENVRLFNELQARTDELSRSVDELTALGEVSRALSSTLDLDMVLQTIVTRANELAGTEGGGIYEYDEAAEVFRLRASSYADPRDAERLDAIGRAAPIPRGQGAAGRAAALREPVLVSDIAVEGSYESPIRAPLLDAGYRAILTVPLLLEERVIGALGVTRKTPGDFAPAIVRVLTTFATQSALAIQNARLFREIEIKSRELEVASQHKSEFLANMSHELRTPLNAIIGFSDVLLQGMFGETTEKQTEYLHDILESGQHLLSLINDILDLSKIEAGRMDLEVTTFDLPTAIDNALLLMRERAARRGIVLDRHVDERLHEIHADERKVKQVLLNLLSNAVKFTPEGGRIEVRAAPVGDAVEVSVKDTGIGIAPEDQEAAFEEFRQVGTSDKKAEGTGLGLALCRKFVELHGGQIWVKSALGQGSTFTFTLPARR